jgi:hypothetical protein
MGEFGTTSGGLVDSTLCSGPKAACGTRRTGRRARFPTPPSTPRRTGASPAGTGGGSTAGSCTLPPPWPAYGDTALGPTHPREPRRRPDRPPPDRRRVARGGALGVVGDTHTTTRPRCARAAWRAREVLGGQCGRGPYPHTDAGAGVRRVFHRGCVTGRSRTSTSISKGHLRDPRTGRCPPRERPTHTHRARFALGAVFVVYPLALCSTGMSTTWAQTSDSKPSSEPLEQLCPSLV